MTEGRREVAVDIHATPQDIWRAMTDPQLTREYYYGTDILSDWAPGARWTSESDGEVYLEGEVIDVDPPYRLVQTFHVVDERPAADDPPSTVSWQITPRGETSEVRVVHEGQGEATMDYTEGGWEHILAGLKALLETDRPTPS